MHPDVSEFTGELERMQLQANIAFCGCETRRNIVQAIFEIPILLEDGLLSFLTLKRLLTLIGSQVHDRCKFMLNHLNKARKICLEKGDDDQYRRLVFEISSCHFSIEHEVQSYALFLLELTYEQFELAKKTHLSDKHKLAEVTRLLAKETPVLGAAESAKMASVEQAFKEIAKQHEKDDD